MDTKYNRWLLDNRKDEKERGITIKSTGINLMFNHQNEEYLFGLIDSPGHVEFSSEVTASLRVTDGALVVVDCVEQVCIQTENVLKQALKEKVKPVLVINKIDWVFYGLELDAEVVYQKFQAIIDKINSLIEIYDPKSFEENKIDPRKGNVVFGSGKDNWGFSLLDFAKIYS